MKQLINVGDILHHGMLNKDYTVDGVNDKGQVRLAEYNGWNEPEWIENYMIVKTKAVKQEISGYELLKNLPGISAGTKSNEYNGRKAFFTNYTAQYPDLNDTTWFKPIYKAKETIVRISNGNVIITDNKVTLGSNTVTFYDITKVNNLLNPPVKIDVFKVNIEAVSIGCQTFLKHDIELVYKAIQNYNK